MPHVYNGCGTWYYGKKNLQEYQGACRFCGKQTTLASYDTRLYGVILMVPILPLGRKHIIDKCPACTRHVAVPLHKWNQAQQAAGEALEAYRRSPANADLAKEVLATCARYRDLRLFLAVAPEIERKLAAHAETCCMVAGLYGVFGRSEDAERVLGAALALDANNEQVRELLAECLLEQGRPAEAEPYLLHIIAKRIPDRVDGLYRLAQGYQVQGDHDKALAVFNLCESVNPDAAQDETFIRLRDASVQRLGTTVSVKPGEVVRRARFAATFRRRAKLVAGVLALAVLGYLATAWVLGMRRQVHLVNGLSKPYVVRLNGREHRLDPESVTKVRLGEGNVKVEMVDAPADFPAETIDVHTPFLTRPFTRHTFVINPDRTAIVVRARIFYTPRSSGRAAPPPQFSYVAGELLQRYESVQHPFEVPPRSVQMAMDADQVSRDVLQLVHSEPRMPLAQQLPLLSEKLGRQTVSQIARRHLLLEPEQTGFLILLSQTMEPQDIASFLRPFLSKRPVLVEWHRMYQTAMSQAGHEEQAAGEYDAMLAKEPQDKNLMYLAGRVTTNIDKSLELTRQAVAGDPPCPWAFFALCGYCLANGQFHEAAEQAERAMSLLPGEPGVQWYGKQALLADGQFDRALALARAEQSGPLVQTAVAYWDEAYIACQLGQRDQALQAVDRLRGALNGMEPGTAERIMQRTNALLAYISGDPSQYVQMLERSSDPLDRLVAHLTAGNLDAAEEAFKQGAQNSDEHLLIYLLATQQDRQDLAERHLRAATEALAKGNYESRAFAKALQGHADLPVSDLLRLRERPVEKAVILTAIGVRDPANRQACFALARKLNFDKRFPYLLIKDVLDVRPDR